MNHKIRDWLGIVALLIAIETKASIPVAQVTAGEEAQFRGLAVGEVITKVALVDSTRAWPLMHPFDLARAEIEAAGRPVEVAVESAGATRQVRLAARTWGIRASLLDEATDRNEADHDKLIQSLLSRAQNLSNDRARDSTWLYVIAAERLLAAGNDPPAKPTIRRAEAAWAEARRVALADDLPVVLFLEATALWRALLFDRAEQVFAKLAQMSVGMFRTRGFVGQAQARFDKRDMPACRELLEAAQAEIDAIAPQSLEASRIWQRMGYVDLEYRHIDDAEANFRRAQNISQQLAPETVVHAQNLRGLAIVASLRGDLISARDYFAAALTMLKQRSPRSLLTARTMSNLGIAYWQLGDLKQAEQWQIKALAITKAIQPNGAQYGGLLNNLGLIYHRRRQFDAALDAYQQAAEIFAEISPHSMEYARGLTNVALAQGLAGRPRDALDTFERVLAIQSAIDPDLTDIFQTQYGIGVNHERLGELDKAESALRLALQGWRSRVPGNLSEGYTSQALGRVMRGQGRHDDALDLLEDALAIIGTLAPGTSKEAKTLFEIAEVHRELADTVRATEAYDRALAALAMQLTMLGGDDISRAHFLEQFANHYKNYIRLLLDTGQERTAFETLEGYRAQSLRAMLAERPKALLRNLSPAQAERQRVHDDALKKLFSLQLGSKHKKERNRLRAKLDELRQAKSADNYSTSAPDFETIAASVPRGTLILSYCVTEQETILFVLSRIKNTTDYFVHRLDLGEKELAAAVQRLRVLLKAPNAGETTLQAMVDLSAELGEQLLAPVRDSIAGAQKLLIIADGPLHVLPFSALIVKRRENGERQYMIDQVPIKNTLSLTIQNQLDGQDEKMDLLDLVAFGDPQFDKSQNASGSADFFLLHPLPYARAEAQSVAKRFLGRSRYFVGSEATESRARFHMPGPRLAHFATHAVLDPDSPLESYLLLVGDENPAGANNGFLQAWEIIEQVTTSADLVTLAACDTGLGRTEGGEGLIGLTRAFHIAGAQNVLSTLWPVADEPSQRLMDRFYELLAAGEEIDEALRMAQLGLNNDGSTKAKLGDWLRNLIGAKPSRELAHPYYWAGYQLSGAMTRQSH